jgi:holo-[acyl-carrier protein] synthase
VTTARHRRRPVRDARVGVDLVDADAFEARFAGRDDALSSVFTEAELTYCRAHKQPWSHLAARFAAKEALLKALGTGLSGPMQWSDIEVIRDPAGAPDLAVTGAVADTLHRAQMRVGSVSLSHTTTHAVAVVLVVPA